MRHKRLESRLSDVATTLVGVPATVHCQSAGKEFVDAGAELGYVRYGPDGVPERETLIKRGPCKALASYLGSDRESPDRDQIVAVHILSHEARHMAGTTDESQAECEAMQRDAHTAQLLGATPEQGVSTGAGLLAAGLSTDERCVPHVGLCSGSQARRAPRARTLVRALACRAGMPDQGCCRVSVAGARRPVRHLDLALKVRPGPADEQAWSFSSVACVRDTSAW